MSDPREGMFRGGVSLPTDRARMLEYKARCERAEEMLQDERRARLSILSKLCEVEPKLKRAEAALRNVAEQALAEIGSAPAQPTDDTTPGTGCDSRWVFCPHCTRNLEAPCPSRTKKETPSV